MSDLPRDADGDGLDPEAAAAHTKRVAWYHRMGPWLGVATGPGIYILGGNLAAHLPPLALALVIPLGTLALTSLILLNGIASRRRREYLVAAVHRTLGRGLGARLLNLVMALSLIGWFSFYSGLSGFSLANLFGLPGWAGSLLLVASMFLLSEVGLTRWNALVWVTTLAALASAVIALLIVSPDPHPAAEGVTGAGPLLWGIGSVIAYSIVFAVRCGDFTWDLESDREVLKSGGVFFITVVIALLVGVALYRRTGEANLAQLLAQSESAVTTLLGHIFLVLAAISPSLSNVYSGAYAMRGVAPIPLRLAALIIVVVGFILGANRFDLQLIQFLDWMGTVLPAVLVVLLASAVLPRKPPPGVAIAAWLAGSLATFLLKRTGVEAYVLVGMVFSLGGLVGLNFLVRHARLAPGALPSE